MKLPFEINLPFDLPWEKKKTEENTVEEILIDAVTGAAGGLLASWAMTFVMKALNRPSKREHPQRQKARAGAGAAGSRGKAAQSARQTSEPVDTQAQTEAQAGQDPTQKVAQAVTKPLGIHLRGRQSQKAGQVVHYVYGGLWGAVFGILAHRVDLPPVAAGALFGTSLWLVSDELLLPALGLSKAPWRYSLSVHGKALAAHAVYGLVTEGAARGLHAATHAVVD